MTRDGRFVRMAPVVALLVGSLLVLLVGALLGVLGLVTTAALAGHLLELWLDRLTGRTVPRQRVLLDGEAGVRILLAQLLVVVFVLRTGELSAGAEGVVVVAVVVHQCLVTAQRALVHAESRLRARRVELRGLPWAGGALPRPARGLRRPAVLLVRHAPVLLPVALLGAVGVGSYGLVAPAALAMVLVALGVTASTGPALLGVARLPRGERLLRLANEAVARHQPSVALYSTGGPQDAHWVRSWLETLEHLQAGGRPTLVLLRERSSFAALGPARVPVLCLPEPHDVPPFRLPTLRVALFAANGPENIRLLRRRSVRSAYIAHGDSDKAASANPFVRVYDEVWVAGAAGPDRYVAAGVAVRPEAFRTVGRPQVARIEAARSRRPGTPYTVLYAPTWQGLAGDPFESSLSQAGPRLVRALLALPDVHVVYRPHPKTDLARPLPAAAHATIVGMLEAAGSPHRASLPGPGTRRDVVADLNEADALLADVSALLSDFIASGKPYLVVNGAGLPDEQFRCRYPSAGGAYLVDRDGTGLERGLADARGPDSMRDRRAQVRSYLIGPPTEDPFALFTAAVDALAARAGPPGAAPAATAAPAAP